MKVYFRKRKFIYVLLALVLAFSMAAIFPVMARAATPIYVDGSCGNDGWTGTSATCVASDGPKLTIQAGVTAVDAGGTVIVAPGTYNENVTISQALTLEGANAGVCAGVDPGTRGPETIIDGYIHINASNVVIDGIKLINGGDIQGSTSGIYMIDQSHITITNSIFVGPASSTYSPNAMILGNYGGSGSQDINVTCNESYNWNMGAYGNPGGGFSTDYLFEYNNFHDNSWCGLGLDVSGVSVWYNNFTNNNIGIEAFRENIVARCNNFDGNTTGIDFYGAFLYAPNNWWGHPSGPSGMGSGSGDSVSANVLYTPFLFTQFQYCLPCPPEPPPVGGELYPVDKLGVVAPWLGLALLLAVGGGFLVLRRRQAH